MWLLGLHVLPTPSPVSLSVPGGSAPSAPHSPAIPAAPTPPNPDQFLKTEHSYPRGGRDYPEVGGSLHQHTQTGHSTSALPLFLQGSSGQVSPARPWSPGPAWGHRTVPGLWQQCCSFPPRAHSPAPGLAAGHGATPRALEKQVFPVPLGSRDVERGRWSLFLCGIAPRARQSCPALWDMHRGGDNPVSPGRVPVPNPSWVAGAGVQQC